MEIVSFTRWAMISILIIRPDTYVYIVYLTTYGLYGTCVTGYDYYSLLV